MRFDADQYNFLTDFGVKIQSDPFHKLENATDNPNNEVLLASHHVESVTLKRATRDKGVVDITDGRFQFYIVKTGLSGNLLQRFKVENVQVAGRLQ